MALGFYTRDVVFLWFSDGEEGIRQYVVDAFTDKVFHGNQAAACVMDGWPSEELMMAIARENNFSETAFTVKEGDGCYRLRWFTPGKEVDLCGHATLATSFVLFNFYENEAERITFHTTLSGDLFVSRYDDFIETSFPVSAPNPVQVADLMEDAMGVRPCEAFLDRDLLLVYDDEAVVRDMRPRINKVALLDGRGVAVTAPGSHHDCVSRFFAPKLAIDEDPVTGSAHCMIAPYWGECLGKGSIKEYQASSRAGAKWCVSCVGIVLPSSGRPPCSRRPSSPYKGEREQVLKRRETEA